MESDELAALEEASMKQEETIYKQMCDMENQWAQQAKETVRIRHAKDYLRTPATLHTSNCWVKDGDWHRISNMKGPLIAIVGQARGCTILFGN